MPHEKANPPTEIDYDDWNDLANNYARKAATLIVDVNGKRDFSTIQKARAQQEEEPVLATEA